MDEWLESNAKNHANEAAKEALPRLNQAMANMQSNANAVYIQAANKAAQRASKVGREQALREAVAEMAAKGVSAFSYSRRDGTTVEVSADVGVRRIINDAMRTRRIEQVMNIASRTGADLVEVSTTANARKSHEAWQGGVYSLTGATPGYPIFDVACRVGDPVNGIGGYNCGHTIALYHEGFERVFDDPLDGTGYTTDEVRALTSEQRRLEREIRKEKRVKEVLNEEGIDTRQSTSRIKDLTERVRGLVNSHHDVLTRRKGYREAIAPILRERAGAAGVVHLDAQSKLRVENATWAVVQRDDWAKKGLGVNKGNQEKHIPGTHQYELKTKKVLEQGIYAEQSTLTISYEECESLIKEHAGNGLVCCNRDGSWNGKELCKASKAIGYYVDPITDNGDPGKRHMTRFFFIIYGKNGSHIVPTSGKNA